MKTGWKIFWGVLVVLILLGIWWGYEQYKKWKGIWDNISFSKPIPQSLDLKGLNLTDLINAALYGKPIDVESSLKMFVTNNSDTDVSFDNFRMRILSNGKLIAMTSDDLYNRKFVLYGKDGLPTNDPQHKNNVVEIEDTVKIQGNNAVDFLAKKAKGELANLDYEVDVDVNGIPVSRFYPIKGTFDW